MSLISYLKKFLFDCASVNCTPKQEEMVNGKAFVYKRYPLDRTHYVLPDDTIKATLSSYENERLVDDFSIEERCDISGEIDSVMIFRAKEAFSLTNVIGAAFGKDKAKGRMNP